MKWFVGSVIFVLCIFDAGATAYAVEYHIGKEANPLMLWCMNSFGIDGFLYIKILLASWVLFLVIGFWDRLKVAKVGGILAAAVYSAVAMYHLVGLTGIY